MKTFSRIMVGLDLSPMDEKILAYTKHLARAFQPDKIYFVHVVPSLAFPKELLESGEDKIRLLPMDEKLEAEMDKVIKHHMKDLDVEYDRDVLEGKALHELLHWIKVKDVDLVVLGNKTLSHGSGVVPRKVVRNSDKSVLFIPESPPFNIKRILVPVDFSHHAAAALREAVRIGQGMAARPEIVCLNIFDVPTELHFEASRTYTQFAKMVEERAKDTFQSFIGKIDTGGLTIRDVYVENKKYNIAGHLDKYADSNEVDLVVMGAKGLSGLERLLLGSVAEKYLMYNDIIPTLVVKG